MLCLQLEEMGDTEVRLTSLVTLLRLSVTIRTLPPPPSHCLLFLPKTKLSITKRVVTVAALKMWNQFHITITSPEAVAIHDGT